LTAQSDEQISADHNTPLSLSDDYRHTLKPNEHEAFYFLFTSPEADVFGFVRALFDPNAVLELVAVHIDGHVWVHQQRTALPNSPLIATAPSGPSIKLTCREPWQAWDCYFRSTVREVNGEKELRASLNLEFVAINAPDLYRFGLYQQAQQDGRLSGRLQVGKDERAGEFICYRDHSWGHRPMGAAAGWTIASVPGQFYVVVAETPRQPLCLGRFTTPDGQLVPVHIPQIAAVDEGWSITDPGAGIGTWHVKRLAPPFEVYLGPAGQETFRSGPRPGDLYLDEIGPAHFTSPEGEQVIGFLERARGLT
jgi:hypothetical protein